MQSLGALARPPLSGSSEAGPQGPATQAEGPSQAPSQGKGDTTFPAAPPAPTKSSPPTGSVGEYEVERELARGGMGVVYLARHKRLDRRVALKMMLAGANATPEDVERFAVEARAAARLRHPHIVGIHEVGEDAGRPYFAMDFLEGEALDEVLEREGPLDPRDAARVCELLAGALYYAHSQAILHRDLKPANVIRTPGGPVLTDFGLAKDVRAGEGVTVAGEVMGTPAFMPPEQAGGELDQIDRRSDVYSLGATLFTLLTGQPPFRGETALNVLTSVLTKAAPRPSALRPGLPRDLETICMTCLEKEPERRYASMQALEQDLARFRQGEAIVARPPSPARRFGLWLRRNKTFALTASVGVLAVVATIVYLTQISPRLAARAQQTALAGLRAEVEAALTREGRRLSGLPPLERLSEARVESVGNRLRAEFARTDPREVEVLDEVLAGYRASPHLAKACFDLERWPEAYRYAPDSAVGLAAQVELADLALGRGELAQAAAILRRVESAARAGQGDFPRRAEVPALLGRVLLEQGEVSQAYAALAANPKAADQPPAIVARAFGERRQRLALPPLTVTHPGTQREPITVLHTPPLRVLLPWRRGWPCFEADSSGHLRRIASPLAAALEPGDQVHHVVAADFVGDERPELFVTLARPGAGVGYALLASTSKGWKVRAIDLGQRVEPTGLCVADFDGQGRAEALVCFQSAKPEHWWVGATERGIERRRAHLPTPLGGVGYTPLYADLDGDGDGELVLLGGPSSGLACVVEDARSLLQPNPPAATCYVGRSRYPQLLPGGDLALLVSPGPDTQTEAQRQFALKLLRYREGELREHHVPLSRETTRGLERFAIAGGQVAGQPALAFFLERNAEEAGVPLDEGWRLWLCLGDPRSSAPVRVGIPPARGLRCVGEELLLVRADSLVVRGPLTATPTLELPAPRAAERARERILLDAAEDLLADSSPKAQDAARGLLAEVRARGGRGALEATRIEVDGLLQELRTGRRALAHAYGSKQAGRAAELREREAETRNRAEGLARAAAEGAERGTLARRLWEQAAEAAVLARAWDRAAAAQVRADEASPRDGARLSEALDRLSKLGERVLIDGPPTDDLPWLTESPLRSPLVGQAREVRFESNTRSQVLGFPLRYGGGALELEFDFRLSAACFATRVGVGLLPAEGADRLDSPLAVHFSLSEASGWVGSGLTLTHPLSAPLSRYRGRWGIRLGYYPEVGLQHLELIDLDAGRTLVSSTQDLAPGTGAALGDYVLGVRLFAPEGDGWLTHSSYPSEARLAIDRVCLRAAQEGTEWRTPDALVRRAGVAGARYLAGRFGSAFDLWGRALQRDPSDARAVIHRAASWRTPQQAQAVEEEVLAAIRRDPYRFALAYDDCLQGADAKPRLRVGRILRQATPKDPSGLCGLLTGAVPPAPPPALRGESPAAAYLRIRSGSPAAQDRRLLNLRGLSRPAPLLPVVSWSGSPAEGKSLAAEVRKLQKGGLKAISRDRMKTWLTVARRLLVAPEDPVALELWALLAVLRRAPAQAERPARLLAKHHPDQAKGHFYLAMVSAVRRDLDAAFASLRLAKARGMTPRWLTGPLRKLFDPLRRDPRFAAFEE